MEFFILIYLLTGLLIAFILIFITSEKKTDIKKQLPLILLSALLLLFAISNKVTFNEKLIFNFYLNNTVYSRT